MPLLSLSPRRVARHESGVGLTKEAHSPMNATIGRTRRRERSGGRECAGSTAGDT